MSFILDALKKSEAERQRRAGPALLEMRVVRPQRRLPPWLLIGGGVLLLINLLGVLWLAFKPPPGTSSALPTPVVTSPPALPTRAPVAGGVVPMPPSDRHSDVTTVAPYVAASDEAVAEQLEADNAPAVNGTATTSRLPRYQDLANELPALRLDFHVYAPTAAGRYAFINMHKVREGETTAEGARVIAITRDGVELRYQNSEFLLSSEQR